ncbi:hypothetical protein P3T76_003700 [Phytophthora citrophthora]|uniref:Uncharacterized protein n=1 Tax=Phytophthora citrophthora TaxID=4793 RepID=A0AAD9GUS3_9STRA|nr:hypothetical protein P3T76_003700 [Phytophthora citrophthora]
MTTSSTVSASNVRQPQDPQLVRTNSELRLDMQRPRSVPKITGRKLRTPRKFVITDVPDDELNVSMDTASDASEQPRDDNNSNNNNNEDLSASNSSARKGKTQVKGRFTITDLSPESPEASPEREDLSVSMGPTTSRALEAPRRLKSRKLATRRPFQSAGDARTAVGLTKARLSQQQQQLQQQDGSVLASFSRAAASSPSSRSMRSASPARPPSNQISSNNNSNNQTQTVFDHHLEFLEKETHEMKSVLEKMVATNAQWIEALTSAGLVHAPRLRKRLFPNRWPPLSHLWRRNTVKLRRLTWSYKPSTRQSVRRVNAWK